MSCSYDDHIKMLKKQEQAMIPYDGKPFDEPVSKILYADRREERRGVSLHAHLHIHQAGQQHYEPMPTYYPDDFEYGIGVPMMAVVVFVGGFIFVVLMLIGLLAGG